MHPLQILLDPISLIVIGMFFGLYIWESLLPRNKNLPKVKYATLRGLLSFMVFFYLGAYLPLLTDEYLADFQLLDISYLATSLQVLIGLLFYQLVVYIYHRTVHHSNLLWRVFHQMHHSSERLDIPSTYYFSLAEMVSFTFLGSICFALIVGLSPLSISIVIFSLNFLSQFQHANIRTPQWLGWFIQRPEQHALHHARGEHKYNYSDFPIYDYLFGTFRNPIDYEGENGFYDGASSRIKDMLLFRDISKQEK